MTGRITKHGDRREEFVVAVTATGRVSPAPPEPEKDIIHAVVMMPNKASQRELLILWKLTGLEDKHNGKPEEYFKAIQKYIKKLRKELIFYDKQIEAAMQVLEGDLRR